MGAKACVCWWVCCWLLAGVQAVAASSMEAVIGDKRLQIYLSDEDVSAPLHQKIESLLNHWQSRMATETPPAMPVAGNSSLVKICIHWQQILGVHFSCQQQALLEPWQGALRGGDLPDRSAQRQQARQLASLSLQDAKTFSPPPQLLDALLLEALAEVFKEHLPVTSSLRLQMGELQIFIHPTRADRLQEEAFEVPLEAPVWWKGSTEMRLAIARGALVHRNIPRDDWRIGDRRFVPLINPVDGWPVHYANRLLVVAPDALTAASIAEGIATMSIAEALAHINRIPDVEAVMMTETGKLFPSEGWYSLVIPDPEHPPLWTQEREFLIEYEIPAQNTAEYRRPYAAVWITDEQQRPVRQLLVHGKSLRWLREIPLWWRRHGRRDEAAIDGLSRATPQPGHHLLVWDGRDDQGQAVGAGRYQLNIEVSREHGERELLRMDFELTEKDLVEKQDWIQKQQGQKELGWVKISLRSTVD